MVHNRSPETAKVAFFGALFAARTDIYATRWDNPHTGKHGWIPAVRGMWRKGVRHEDRGYLPLTAKVIESHLRGEVRDKLDDLITLHVGPVRHTITVPREPAGGIPVLPSSAPGGRLAYSQVSYLCPIMEPHRRTGYYYVDPCRDSYGWTATCSKPPTPRSTCSPTA